MINSGIFQVMVMIKMRVDLCRGLLRSSAMFPLPGYYLVRILLIILGRYYLPSSLKMRKLKHSI